MSIVDRQAVIDAVTRYCTKYDLRELLADIEVLPSAQKQGKWIRTRTMEHDGELYCTRCEQEHPEQKNIWNFCPNCGAYMRGEQE